jgi:hypothetical protein
MSDKPGSQQTRIWSGGEMPVETLDELERQISLSTISRRMIGDLHGDLAGADGWGCARCAANTIPASWWAPTKNCFTAMAAGAASILGSFMRRRSAVLSGNLERRYTNFWYLKGAMSALNGDKARFHRERKSKLARRERIQALRKKLAVPEARRPDGRDL